MELRKSTKTIFQQFSNKKLSGYSNSQLMMPWYHSYYEHLMLAAAWMGSGYVPTSFIAYELSLADPVRLRVPELKLAAHMIRGVVFFKKKWTYMAEEEFSGYLSVAKKNKAALIPVMKAYSVTGIDSADEALYAQIHAPGVLLRGLDRLTIDKEEAGDDDLDSFLGDAKKMNLSTGSRQVMDNEPVWLIGAYVKIRREKTDEAVVYIENFRPAPISAIMKKKCFASLLFS